MRKVLLVVVSATVLAAGPRFTAVNRAYAEDELSAAKSLGETAPGEEQGLVGYWNFDEGMGKAAKDSSRYGNDGEMTGAKWARGVIGSALEFNGLSDYVNMRSPGSGINDNAVTVEAWIRSTGNNVNANLVFAGPESHGFGIWIQGGRFFAGIWNSSDTQYSAISAIGPTPGPWYHVAMTCDFETGKVVKLYINGQLNCTSAATGAGMKSGHTTIDIGGRTPHSWYFNGIMDEVKIYNRALSEGEIRKPYDDYMQKRAEEIDTHGYRNSPWIWTGNPEHRTAYFRKPFTAPDVSGRRILLICDGDKYQVLLNEKTIIPCKEYSEAQVVDITEELRTGDNVLAAQATNKGTHAGFFAYIGYRRRESPEGYEMLANGEGMKCSAQAVKDWHSRDCDDSQWTRSHILAGFDKGLALRRNFPDLGLGSKDAREFAPPELDNGQSVQCKNQGLTLVLRYTEKKHTFHVDDSVTHETWFLPGPPFVIDDYVSAWEGGVSCEKIDNGFTGIP